MEIFEKFDKGQLALPERVVDFNSLKWNEHPTFEGVALKHIVTANRPAKIFLVIFIKKPPNQEYSASK